MKENFITKINIKHSRNVENLEIPLAPDRRQHLILTGRNGSGKTSLLLEINKFLAFIDNGQIKNHRGYTDQVHKLNKILKTLTNEKDVLNTRATLKKYEERLKQFGETDIHFSNEYLELNEKSAKGEFLLAFFDSKRLTSLNIPQGINKFNLQKKYNLNQKANAHFIQYIVNLKADKSFARDDNEMDVVKEIDEWFARLEKRLQLIFDSESLKLSFNRKTYNFDIDIEGRENFSFNNLSDGYSAIISIVTELILRMEAHNAKSYDLEGVVIIDEIETHLHVDLQKKIMPFLVDFFPKLQFIVTTHSPFVLSSIANATICDLETRTVTTDLSNYSYDALLESYFKTDKYSDEIKFKLSEFDKLSLVANKTKEQIEELSQLRNYFAHAPKYLSKELLVRLQQIELNELTRK